jgi:hypothetical protein
MMGGNLIQGAVVHEQLHESLISETDRVSELDVFLNSRLVLFKACLLTIPFLKAKASETVFREQ